MLSKTTINWLFNNIGVFNKHKGLLCPWNQSFCKILYWKTKYAGELVSSNTPMILKINLRLSNIMSQKQFHGFIFVAHSTINKEKNETQWVKKNLQKLKKWLKCLRNVRNIRNVKARNVKVNINKKRVMFSNLNIWETTKCLSKTTDFNCKVAVDEKKIISYHCHVFHKSIVAFMVKAQNNNTTLKFIKA